MKVKGFTLIELLAVIVILGIILGIAVPSVINIIERAEQDTFNRNLELVKKTAKTYFTSNTELLPQNIGDYNIITLQDLIDNQLIDEVKDPKDNTNCNTESSLVKVQKLGANNFIYDPYITCLNYQSKDNSNPEIKININGNDVYVVTYDEDALFFDGIDDYIMIPNSSTFNFGTNDFTVVVKMKVTKDSADTDQIFSKRTTSPVVNTEMQISSTGVLYGYMYETSGAVTGSSILVPLQEVVTLTYQRSNDRMKLWIDGTNVADIATTGNLTTTQNIYIGRDISPYEFMNANLYEFSIWNKALTESEIVSYAETINNYNPDNLLAYYKVNSNMDNQFVDYLGINNGNIYGTTYVHNSGVKRIKVDSSEWIYNDTHTFTGLTTGTHTIYVEDNVGNVTTRNIVIP